MSFYRITYHPQYRFATLHNYGCTFRCPFCSYKLRSGENGTPGLAYPPPNGYLTIESQKAALRKVAPRKVYLMGGEPTTAPEHAEILRFAKEELGAETRLGHTNGSKLPLPYLDGANVGFKAFSPELHRQITGRPAELIYDNFRRAYDAGLKLAANMVYVPGLVELDEFEGLLKFLAGLDRDIPFHIMGYIPVPGQPYRRPTAEEIAAAGALSRTYQKQVAASHLTTEQALDLSSRDDRFQVEVIAEA